jgi:citrate synthase
MPDPDVKMKRMNDDWMTAEQAAQALGVTRSTLYAYVSRGLVRSAPASGTPQSRYRRHEVERLAVQRESSRKPALVARASLDWGRPVLNSELTLIEAGRLYYRGRDAIELSRHATLEDVAALLLRCDPADFATGAPPRIDAATLRTLARLDPVPGCTAGFAWLQGLDDGGASREPAPSTAAQCARLLRLMTAVAARRVPARGPAHRQLARAWRLDEHGGELLRQALVLCADHELNASSFAARCVASTGAELGACVTAGLAALSGTRHGGVTTAIESLWDGALKAGRSARAMARLVDASLVAAQAGIAGFPGQSVTGFGHPLYPDGDPRAAALLAQLPRQHRNERLQAAVLERNGQHPSIDYALVAMRRALGLPQGHAYLTFALARTAGWLAHAVEQGRSDVLIRPRAAYVGERPAREPADTVPAALASRIIRRR